MVGQIKPKGTHGGARKGSGRVSNKPHAIGTDGRLAARKYAEKAMATLADLLTSPQHTVRLGAACAILDRAYGRPAQSIAVGGVDGESPVQHKFEVVFIDSEHGIETRIPDAHFGKTIDHNANEAKRAEAMALDHVNKKGK